MTLAEKLPWLLLLLAISLGSPGCSGNSDRPELGLVNGNVTLDGKPWSGVIINFQPVKGKSSAAKVDDEGNYELMYDINVKGAALGPNKVAFQYLTGETGPLIPQKYRVSASDSVKEKVQVEAGTNTFDFNLESDEPGSNKKEPIED